jgi:adenylyltransferase/sulfurtransferase
MWDEKELAHYERQVALIGRRGQKKLKQAKVLLAGAGGLGTAVASYLTAAGIGYLEIVDRDRVRLSNLNRQILFSENDEGKSKAPALARRLRLLNPHIEIAAKAEDLVGADRQKRFSAYDVLVDALDNFPSRYVLNKAALEQGIPLIHGSIRGYYGQLTTVTAGLTACLRCLFPESPETEVLPVLGPVCGVIGCLQAMEVIKYLLGNGSLLMNRLLVFDGLRGAMETVELKRRPDCPDCGGAARLPGAATL